MAKAALAALMLIGANTCTSSEPRAPDEQKPQLEQMTVELSRTSCFGPCPVYTVSVTPDGGVHWQGREHVSVEGEATSTIDAEDVAFLQLAVARSSLLEMRDAYEDSDHGCLEVWTDHPSVEIVVTTPQEKKKVRYYLGCRGVPEQPTILWLASTIDEVAGTSKWVGPRLLRR